MDSQHLGFFLEHDLYFHIVLGGGGICMDGGAHWIRPLRMWLGEIDEVVAVTGRQIPEMEGESYARSMLRFESGVVAIFDALNGGMFIGPGEEFRITGTLGAGKGEVGEEVEAADEGEAHLAHLVQRRASPVLQSSKPP